MTSITIRNIPNDIIDIVKTLAQSEKRSMNNEILLLIEKGIINYINQSKISDENLLPNEIQIKVWKELRGKWKDARSTKKIIDDIYNSRTTGREVSL